MDRNYFHTEKIIVPFCILLTCLSAAAQEASVGDSSVVSGISAYLRSVYDTQDTTFEFVTNKQFKKIKTTGSKIRVEKKKGQILRIAIISFVSKGDFAEEYWFKDDQLVFVYQTFSYFEEVPSLTKAINFTGSRFWETRYYLEAEKLKFQKSTGTKEKELTYAEADLLNQKEKLLKYLKFR